MTEQQKRYKILKRTRYEEQISHENKITNIRALWLGLTASAAILGFLSSSQHDPGSTLRAINAGAGIITAGYSTYQLKNIIEAISRKTMLQGKIEDINTELAMSEMEEEKGRRR